MNKKYVKATLIAVVTLISGINVFNTQKTESLSDMALANVEALADDEDVDMRRGYILVEKSKTCSVCEWTGGSLDYCNVHEQLPDCYL